MNIFSILSLGLTLLFGFLQFVVKEVPHAISLPGFCIGILLTVISRPIATQFIQQGQNRHLSFGHQAHLELECAIPITYNSIFLMAFLNYQKFCRSLNQELANNHFLLFVSPSALIFPNSNRRLSSFLIVRSDKGDTNLARKSFVDNAPFFCKIAIISICLSVSLAEITFTSFAALHC